MFSDLIQQLQQLQRGFSALPASLEDADALSDEALAFRHAARSSQDQLGEPESVDAARWSRAELECGRRRSPAST